VANTKLAAGARKNIALTYERHDGTRDHVPVLIELYGDDGLEIEVVALAVSSRADTGVVIALEGHTDQGCNWIGKVFGEIMRIALCLNGDWSASQAHCGNQ